MQAVEFTSSLTGPRVWAASLPEHIGESVRLAGWLHRYRQLGKISFLILRDRSGLAQIVVDDPGLQATLGRLGNESVIEVRGIVAAEPQAPGGVELRQPEVAVLSEVDEQLPFEIYMPELTCPTANDSRSRDGSQPAPAAPRILRDRGGARARFQSDDGEQRVRRDIHPQARRFSD